MPKKKNEMINFEEMLEELENSVSKLESGNLSLDDSLKEFEAGVKLYKNCQGLLAQAEKTVTILTESLKEENYYDTDE